MVFLNPLLLLLLLLFFLGIGVSTLFPKQCPVRCTMGQKPQCREFYKDVDGPDPAPKSSGNAKTTHLPRLDCQFLTASKLHPFYNRTNKIPNSST